MARIVQKKKKSIKPKKAIKPAKAQKAIRKTSKKALKKTVLTKVVKQVTAKKSQPKKAMAKKIVSKPLKKFVTKKNSTEKVAKKKVASLTPKATSVVAAIVKSTSPASLTVGSKAPVFSMPATQVGDVSSDSLKGKAYVLYFYPKDDTSGCTAEACEFRNTLPNFSRLGITVIGVSKDNMESHGKFSSKYNLTFPLASDHTTSVCESYGTWTQKSMYGRSYMGIERSTFVIDEHGVIRAIWRKVSVPGHVEDVRKVVESL